MSVLGLITCPDCGKQRQKRYDPCKHPDRIIKCIPCKMKGNKAGCHNEHKPYRGRGNYTMVWIDKDDFFFPMAHKAPNGNYGVIAVHRLVMAQHLGRCLQSWEIVHHKGIRYTGIENKSDNSIDNLELTTNGEHTRDHSKGYRDGYQRGLYDGRTKQIQLLKEEIRRFQNA